MKKENTHTCPFVFQSAGRCMSTDAVGVFHKNELPVCTQPHSCIHCPFYSRYKASNEMAGRTTSLSAPKPRCPKPMPRALTVSLPYPTSQSSNSRSQWIPMPYAEISPASYFAFANRFRPIANDWNKEPSSSSVSLLSIVAAPRTSGRGRWATVKLQSSTIGFIHPRTCY